MSSRRLTYNEGQNSLPHTGGNRRPSSGVSQPASAGGSRGPSPSPGCRPEPDADGFIPVMSRNQRTSGGRQPNLNENFYQSPVEPRRDPVYNSNARNLRQAYEQQTADGPRGSNAGPSTPRSGGYLNSATPPRTGNYNSRSPAPGSARGTPPPTGNYASVSSRPPPATANVHGTTARSSEHWPSLGNSTAPQRVQEPRRAFEPERREGAPGVSSSNFGDERIDAAAHRPFAGVPEEVQLQQADANWKRWVRSHCNSVLHTDADWERLALALTPFRQSHRGKDAILPKAPKRRTTVNQRNIVRKTLKANYFKLDIANPNPGYSEYNISWHPYTQSKDQRRDLYHQLLKVYGRDENGINRVIPVYNDLCTLFTSEPFNWSDDELKKGVNLRFPHLSPIGREMEYTAIIKKEHSLDLADLTKFLEDDKDALFPSKFIQMLDLVVKQYCLRKYLECGHSFYEDGSELDLSEALSTMSGYFQSVRALRGGLFLNVDVSTTVFYKEQYLIDHWQSVLKLQDNSEQSINFDRALRNRRPLGYTDLAAARAHFKNMRVVETLLPLPRIVQGQAPPPIRTFKIYDLTDDPATDVNVQDWSNPAVPPVRFPVLLSRKYHYQEDVGNNLPCVKVSKNKECYLPWSCCKIQKGQRFRGKLSDALQREMLKQAVKTPKNRLESVQKWIKERYKRNDDRGGGIRPDIWGDTFKFDVNTDLVTVTALIMPRPNVKSAGRSVLTHRADGSFRLESNSRMLKAARIGNWAMLVFGCDIPQKLGDIVVKDVKAECRKRGLEWKEDPVINPVLTDWERAGIGRNDFVRRRRLLADDLAKLIQDFEEVITEKGARSTTTGEPAKLDLIVCLMKKKLTPEYGALKQLCDRVHGVPTQVILVEKNFSKYRDERSASRALLLQNIMLKINVKCGGFNFAVDEATPMPTLTAESTMLLGADVTHPNAGEDGGCSIAAVVGTTDVCAHNYACRIRVQDGRQEEIVEFKEMVLELLQEFHRQERTWPTRILYFRDGVSESQYVNTLKTEGIALMDAARQIDPSYCPKIFIAVVMKRHHTRFYETKLENDDPNCNIPAGTVVDTEVTHPREYDFYLCSHPPGQGTSRPVHYHVLVDQIEICPEDLYSFIFSMCHTYVRCTKPVSVIPPVYYAHLAAFRARHYMSYHNAMEELRIQGIQNPRQRAWRKPDDLNAHPRLRDMLWFV